MARQTPREKLSPLAAEYYKRYIRFSEQMHNAWMQYAIQTKLIEIVNEFSATMDLSTIIFECISPINPDRRKPSRIRIGNLSGMVKRAYRKDIPESVFVNSIGLFEAFVSDIAKVAYLDNPSEYLLEKNKKDDNVGEGENIKLLRILLESNDREDAIEKYVDEKLRGIFYGNPIDVFKKNKLRLNIHKQLSQSLKSELIVYEELIARRNVLVHSLGVIDAKYLREVKDTSFTASDKVDVDEKYLHKALSTLNMMAKQYVNQVALRTTGKKLPQVRL